MSGEKQLHEFDSAPQWCVLEQKKYDAQVAELAKFWFDTAKKHGATISRLTDELKELKTRDRSVGANNGSYVERLFNDQKQKLAGALAANALLKDDNSRQGDTIRNLQGELSRVNHGLAFKRNEFDELKYRHASSSSKIANLNGLLMQKDKEIASRDREIRGKAEALGNAYAELKQYKARVTCASAALEGKEGQYQLQEIAKPKPAPVVSPAFLSWLNTPLYSGIRA